MAGSVVTVGRIVHFQVGKHERGEFEPGCQAAIVTQVHDAESGIVDLAVFTPLGLNAAERMRHVLSGKPGEQYTWHWPEPAPEAAAEDAETEA